MKRSGISSEIIRTTVEVKIGQSISVWMHRSWKQDDKDGILRISPREACKSIKHLCKSFFNLTSRILRRQEVFLIRFWNQVQMARTPITHVPRRNSRNFGTRSLHVANSDSIITTAKPVSWCSKGKLLEIYRKVPDAIPLKTPDISLTVSWSCTWVSISNLHKVRFNLLIKPTQYQPLLGLSERSSPAVKKKAFLTTELSQSSSSEIVSVLEENLNKEYQSHCSTQLVKDES